MKDSDYIFSIENDPYQHIIKLMCNKWKPYIIQALIFEEKKFARFSTFTKQLPITERVLAKNLKELEKDEIIYKTIYPEVPPRVEYRLTKIGKTLSPILFKMYDWAWEDMKRKKLCIDPLGEMWHGKREPNKEFMKNAYKK
jgi:DNA-binding HxlR family transcriptional regulator